MPYLTNVYDMIRPFLPNQTDGHSTARASNRVETTAETTPVEEVPQDVDNTENNIAVAAQTPGPPPGLVQPPPVAKLPPPEPEWKEVVVKGRRSEVQVVRYRDAQNKMPYDHLRQRTGGCFSEPRSGRERGTLSESIGIMRAQSDRSMADLEGRCRQLETRAERYKQELEYTCDQLCEATRALDACKLQQQEMAQLLDIRAGELRNAQAALSGPHTTSHGDVTRMVDQLNAEVYQMSALMTDHFPFEDRHPSLRMEHCPLAYEQISQNVGAGLAHGVMTRSHADDSTFVQVIIQAYVVERIWWAVHMWSFTVNPVLVNMLSDLHERIFLAESQSISARWRSLTKRYLDYEIDQQATIKEFQENLTIGLVGILVMAGVPLPNEKISSQIHDGFGERISTIITRTLELRKVIGVDITDSEFEILRPHYGGCFCRESMENIEEAGSGRKTATAQDGQLVLCTTEIGLRRREKKVGEDNRGFTEASILVKAKVALYSMLEEFAQQQQDGARTSVNATPKYKNPTVNHT